MTLWRQFLSRKLNGPEKDLWGAETVSLLKIYFLVAAFFGVFTFLGLAAFVAFLGDLVAAFLGLAAAFFAAGFLAAGFLAAVFLGVLAFFAAGFLAAGFLAAGFFAAVFFVLGLAAFGLAAFFATFAFSPSLKDPEAPVPLTCLIVPAAIILFKDCFKCTEQASVTV